MALFQKTGNDYQKLTYLNRYLGESIILCGTGPSLHGVDPEGLRKKGMPILGLNNSFEIVDLDFWMTCDSPDQFDKKIWEKECLKFCAWNWREESAIQDRKNILFYKAYGLEVGHSEEFDESLVVNGPYINFVFEGCTFPMALHMVYWLGFRRVFLVGCDFGGKSHLSTLSNKFCEEHQKLNLERGFNALREASDAGALELISCTADSPINSFLPYEEWPEVATLKV
jgi:hypothetical protein